MSNIEKNLETIRKGVYGKDVRQAIHDAIEECYADGHAGAVDLIARERINTLIGGTGDLVEVPLFEELELFAYDQTFTIDPDEYSISDFDYIAVYYKVVASGAPEVKWYTANDFLTLPVVISGVFLENAGHKLSAREIHIRCTDTDDQTFEVYLANNWKLNGSDAADGGTYTEVEATDEEKAGIISMISGIKFAPSAEVADIRVGEDGTTYASAGEAVRTQISDVKSQISDIEEQIEGGGLTSAIKQALLQLAQKVAYIDENGQDYYDDLYDALYAVTAISLNTNSLSFSTLNSTQQLTATTTPEGGAVTWNSSDTSVATVSETGLVTSVGYGNATITATSGGLSATCSVVIAQATLTSISAVYTQSGTVYSDASLDSLKTDLVVTAHWSNSTTSTVASADYTLSGTLTVGTSTVTVSYGGQTATFNVTVTQARTILYQLTEPVTMTTSGSKKINTGVKILATDTDLTIVCDWINGTITNNMCLLHCIYEASPYYGMSVQKANSDSYGWLLSGPNSSSADANLSGLSTASNAHNVAVIRHTTSDGKWIVDGKCDGVRITQVVINTAKTVTGVDSPLMIGAKRSTSGTYSNYFAGTVNSVVVYDDALTDAEVESILSGE